MARERERQPDIHDKLTRAVHLTLLIGLLLSGTLLLAGGGLFLSGHREISREHRHSIAFLVEKSVHGDATAVLNLGLLLLMLTPIARVVVLAVGWLVERQWRFGLVALSVLVLLILSVTLGAR